jgi:hypothetical protein
MSTLRSLKRGVAKSQGLLTKSKKGNSKPGKNSKHGDAYSTYRREKIKEIRRREKLEARENKVTM